MKDCWGYWGLLGSIAVFVGGIPSGSFGVQDQKHEASEPGISFLRPFEKEQTNRFRPFNRGILGSKVFEIRLQQAEKDKADRNCDVSKDFFYSRYP